MPNEPFDQQLYNQIIAQSPRPNNKAPRQWADGYNFGVVDVAMLAARLAAQPSAVPSDDDIARAIYRHVSGDRDPEVEGWDNYNIDNDEGYGEPQGKQAYVELARAVRPALSTGVVVPEIPSGWNLANIDTLGEDQYEACLVQDILRPYPTPLNDPVWGKGPTWHEALAAACAAATAEGVTDE